MKKNYSLFFALFLISIATVGQSILGPPQHLKKAELKPNEAEEEALIKNKIPKAFNDTFFFEEFTSTSVANNWTITTGGSTPTPWIWAPSTRAPGGQYSTNVAPLNSTSNANGFILLPSDFYNTPTPAGGFIEVSSTIQSGPINLLDSNNNPRASVIARWQQAVRYCCSGASELRIDVSTDGLTWTTFDATNNQGGNTVWPNGQSNEINLSCVLGGADTGYIRFRQEIATHYYWMIDDFALVEGPSNNIELEYTEIDFHPSYPLVPQYYEVPLPNLPAIFFEGAVRNRGGNVATNVEFNVDISGDSAIGGGPGIGLVYSASAQVGTGTLQPVDSLSCIFDSLSVDTGFITNPFFTFTPNHYRFNYSATSDSMNQVPVDAIGVHPIKLTHDSIVALERGENFFQGTSGPGAFAASAGIGDVVAGLVIIEDSVDAKGVRFWVDAGRAAELSGISISPRIYGFDQSRVIGGGAVTQPLDSGITGIVCQSPFSVQIDTCTATCPPSQPSIMDTWIDLNFLNACPLAPGTYYFGIEQTAGAGEIWGGRDRGAEENGVLWTNIMFLAGNNGFPPSWGWGGFVIGIRLIADWPQIVNVDEQVTSQLDFEVYPNPNEGLFTIDVSNSLPTSYILNVRNMLGQTVMSEAINVNGNATKNMDLSSFEKGVYFISLENGEDRLVRKVIVK